MFGVRGRVSCMACERRLSAIFNPVVQNGRFTFLGITWHDCSHTAQSDMNLGEFANWTARLAEGDPVWSRLELAFNIYVKDFTMYELKLNFDQTVKFMCIF